MSHLAQKQFCESVKKLYPIYFNNTFVIDCGSMDINGNNRYLFDNCIYIGLDLIYGPNVDMIGKIHELPFRDNLFDVVLSTNALEHDMYWQQSIFKMYKILRHNGLMFFSCGRTWEEHGTTKHNPSLSPTSKIEGWQDYYKNLDESDIRELMNLDALFENYYISHSIDGRDLIFWGIKI